LHIAPNFFFTAEVKCDGTVETVGIVRVPGSLLRMPIRSLERLIEEIYELRDG